MENKYHDVDKSMTEKIMKEFSGKIVDVTCPSCNGEKVNANNEKCFNCQGEGHYEIQY